MQREHEMEACAPAAAASIPLIRPPESHPIDSVPAAAEMIVGWADGVLAEMEQGGWANRKRHVAGRRRRRTVSHDEAAAKSENASMLGRSSSFGRRPADVAPAVAAEKSPDSFLTRLRRVENITVPPGPGLTLSAGAPASLLPA